MAPKPPDVSSPRPLVLPLRFVEPRQLTGYAVEAAATSAYAAAIGASRSEGSAPTRRCVPTDLSPIEHRQCVHMLTAGRESAMRLPELIARLDEVFEGMEDIRLAVIGPPIEWWDVVDADGALQAYCWQFGVDSGVLYPPEDIAPIATYCQGALDLAGLLGGRADGVVWWRALHDAHREAATRYPMSELATREIAGEVICQACQTRLALSGGGDDGGKVAGCKRCRRWIHAVRTYDVPK